MAALVGLFQTAAAPAAAAARPSMEPPATGGPTADSDGTDVLARILAAPLRREELAAGLGVAPNAAFLAAFEAAWARFLQLNPQCLEAPRQGPAGALQRRLAAARAARDRVAAEVEGQVTFFREGGERTQDHYAAQLRDALGRREAEQEAVAARLEGVQRADRLQRQTLPWHCFLHRLDTLAKDRAAEPAGKPLTALELQHPPSARARLLLGEAMADVEEPALRRLLRAHAVDRALLQAHRAMLQREIERHEAAAPAQELAGRLFAEQNVWGILNGEYIPEEAAEDNEPAKAGGGDGANANPLDSIGQNLWTFVQKFVDQGAYAAGLT